MDNYLARVPKTCMELRLDTVFYGNARDAHETVLWT